TLVGRGAGWRGCGDERRCTNNTGSAPTCTAADQCAEDNGGCRGPALVACAPKDEFVVAGPTAALTGEEIEFSVASAGELAVSDYDVEWSLDTSESLSTPNAPSIRHRYARPSRYRVVAKLTRNASPSDVIHVIHYVDVARPYDETVYSVRDTAFGPSTTETYGSPQFCGFTYDVYYGKYTEFWNQQGVDTSREHILQVLALLDTLFEMYGELFGWDFPANPATRYTVCEDVGGAGAGREGIFVSTYLTEGGKPFDRFELATLIHEAIHTWDFRGQLYTQGPDTAHVLTTVLERQIQGDMNLALIGAYQDTLITSPGRVYERSGKAYFLRRYLENPEYNWDTYFSPEIQALSADEIWTGVDHPRNQERLFVQAGFFTAVQDMHGPDALRRLFLEIDRLEVENPEWASTSLSTEQRLNNMFIALTNALGVDVSPYFDHWKVPLTDEQRAIAEAYPRSRTLVDSDLDSFSPLEGDLDDCDPDVYPGAPELDDGKDNNQEGQVDERVFRESDLGDFDSIDITVPAVVSGDLPDSSDVDEIRITNPNGRRIAIIIHPGSAHRPAPYTDDDAKLSHVFVGSISMNGHVEPTSPPWVSGEGRGITYVSNEAELVLRLDAKDRDDMNGLPGTYELQLIPDGHELAPWDTETLLPALFPR
ncbi:MAG: putative metal-binding motif-containing protein, partial [Myxococcota bacterium]